MAATCQSFSHLQSRKFLLPTNKGSPDVDANENKRNTLRRLARLCPSMDLILVHSTKSLSSLVIYRTLSWEKATGIVLPEALGDTGDGVGGANSSSNDCTPLSYCWSPNGQCVAVAHESSIYLYGVESLVTASGIGGDGTTSGSSNASWTIDLREERKRQGSSICRRDQCDDTPTEVSALHWVHVGRHHPTASSTSSAEDEQEVSWRYQCNYIDQSTKFLPPSAYYSNNESAEMRGVSTDDPESLSLAHSLLPECKTPLSVLCVSMRDMDHWLYLHGHYPLLRLPKSKSCISETAFTSSARANLTRSPLVVASNDLAYWLTTTPTNTGIVHSEKLPNVPAATNFLTIHHTPFLKRDRYALQQIATLHTSISAHLQTIQRSISIVADSWKTSLRTLDQKLLPLIGLLRNYGVEVDLEAKETNNNIKTSLSKVIREYITVGHVSNSSSIANAMDQFFTGVQMNDQLIQRMERSLLASMANVESTAIRCLLRPTQALGWQIQEMVGLVRHFNNISHEDEEYGDEIAINRDISNNKSLLVQELTEATEELWISIENVITSIVSGRMVVRDFCGWLRHAGSQVKARGTAPNSVQRENAKKRRISQAILERLVIILNRNGERQLFEDSTNKQQIGISEALLHLNVTAMLKPMTEKIPTRPPSAGPEDCQQSPCSVNGILYPAPNVYPSLQRTIEAKKSLFCNPLSNIPDEIQSTDVFLPLVSENEDCKIATHSRVGRDSDSRVFWDDEEDEDEGERTYFLPNIGKNNVHCAGHAPTSGLENCRQWFLIAQAHGTTIQLFCLPMGWNENSSDIHFDDCGLADENYEPGVIPFYLTSKLLLPVGGNVLNIGFYGDDGKSSLSSGIDSGTGVEGRQKIGFTYQRKSPSSATELWMTSYDNISWQAVQFDPMLLNFSHVDPSCSKKLLPISVGEDIDEDGILLANCRTISEESSTDICELALCGSRGVGSVATMSTEGLISLELLDLEDDEEDEEDDDEGSY